MDWTIKKNGRVFRCIKFRPFTGMEHFKPESNTSEGDLFLECNDGWFKNRSTEGRTDILNIECWEEFYEEVTEQNMLDTISLEHYSAALKTDPDLQEFNESLKALMQIATPKNTTFSDSGVIIAYDLSGNPEMKTVVDLIDYREQMIRESYGVDISRKGVVPAEKNEKRLSAEALAEYIMRWDWRDEFREGHKKVIKEMFETYHQERIEKHES